jgi:threonine/homoserine/homoserine lactone efflux protein
MDAGLYLRGMAIGFAVAAALGPIGLLVIRRTIDRGFGHGFVSGLGVATADGLYGAVAAFGLTAVTELLVGIERLLGVIGGAVLVALAARGLRAALGRAPTATPLDPPDGATRISALPTAWASMVVLTLMNPATILSFVALFAAIGAGTGGPVRAALVTAGVLAGSAAWWLILTGVVATLRTRLSAGAVRLLNVASAVVIGAFGVGAIALALAGR